MTTLEKLRSTGAGYRLNGIMECYDQKRVTDEEIRAMKELKKDSFVVSGRRKISTFAKAVLHKLNIEEYTGHDEAVIYLIENLQ